MSEFSRLPVGKTRAFWHGREYQLKAGAGIGLKRQYFLTPLDPDEPDLEGAVYDEDLGGYGVPIDPVELDAWYSTTWYFDWHGQGFLATNRSEDQIVGNLMSGNDTWAKANGLALFDHGWAVGQFPLSEIENLLAGWKSERNKAELKREYGQ